MRFVATIAWWLGLTSFVLAQNVVGTPISKLPLATLPLSGAEVFPLVQGGVTKQAPAGTLPPSPCIGIFVGSGATGTCATTVNGVYIFQNRISTPVTGNPVTFTAISLLTTPSLNAHGGNYVGGAFSAVANSNDNGVFTTLAVAAIAGDTSTTVVNATGVKVGDFFNTVLDNGNQFPATVTGVAGNVVSHTGQAYPSGAAIGQGFLDAKGHFAPLISNGIATSLGTGLLAVEGAEFGTGMQTGSSAYVKCILCLNNNSNDAVHGSYIDAALSFSTQSGGNATYFNTLISINKSSGLMPIGANSWIMQAQAGIGVKGYFDFSNLTCSGGSAILLRNFSVDCGGNAFINALYYDQGENDQSVERFVPTTGQTIVPNVNDSTVVLDPAGTLAALTLQIGGCSVGVNGHLIRISTTQAITSFSLTTLVGTIVSPPTSLAANEGHTFVCNGNTAKLYRAGTS